MTFHAFRHSDVLGKNHTEWDVGCALNHAGSSVTAAYMHGATTDLKIKLLREWADHVEQLAQPAKGMKVIR
jgi:hypothetical protein